jgi:hypothetical protein
VGEFDNVRLSTSSKFSLTEQKKKKTKIQIPCPFFLLGTASNPNNKKREWAAAAGRLSTVSCTHYWRNKADVSTHSVWRKSLVCSGAGGGTWLVADVLSSRSTADNARSLCVCVHVRPRSWPKTTRRICGFRANFFQFFFFFRGRERERERERESNRA